jgi:hypothetical protein
VQAQSSSHQVHLARPTVSLVVVLCCRPPNAQEIVERAPQVIQCNETLREVTLYQNMSGKSMSRTFRYDKVIGYLQLHHCAELQ